MSVKTYETDEIVIFWKPDICEHAGECVRGLPQVFDVDKRPWITPENATAAEIMEVIDRCPTGALSYKVKEQ